MDIKKQVCARRQALRLRIENYKITRNLLPKATMNFKQAAGNINRDIERAERELHMLETTWRF